MSRRRMSAEMIRDSILRASGLLSDKMGGPGVRPPQPGGVTEVAYGNPKWTPSEGEDRYRRSIYTFQKRTAPFAMHEAFDAPTGETCVAQRNTSNTPMQALTLLNDVMFNEAAQQMGKRIVDSAGSDRDRIDFAYSQLLARTASDSEMQQLIEFVEAQRTRFEAGELDDQVIAGVESVEAREQAVWTTLARVLFGLDETITRN